MDQTYVLSAQGADDRRRTTTSDVAKDSAPSLPRPLRILIIADAKIPVPPATYGGTERIAALLCEGLAERGHAVTLMAANGSRNYGRLIPCPWAGRKPYPYRAWYKIRFQALSLWAAHRADVVINFGRTDYLWALLKTRKPLLCRFGNPIGAGETRSLLARRRGRIRLVSISDNQRRDFPSDHRWQTIYNAVPLDRFSFSDQADREYLAFLGRLTANKGVDTAIRVAERTGLPLKIAGNVSDEAGGRAFFECEVRPHLGGRIEWVGQIGDVEKPAFLGQARALLVPIRWDEPFGIVVAEALACGTPVIAMDRGSMPELIRHSVTGFLCHSSDEMVNAIRQIGEIDRCACRAECERRFSVDRMVEQYIAVAHDLLSAPKGQISGEFASG